MTTLTRVYIHATEFLEEFSNNYDPKIVDLEEEILRIIQAEEPSAQIEKIKLFVARELDSKLEKQIAYLKALQKHSRCIEFIFGWLEERVETVAPEDVLNLKLDKPCDVYFVDERATHVNIATEVQLDCHRDAIDWFDLACFIGIERSWLDFPINYKEKHNQKYLIINPKFIKKLQLREGLPVFEN